MSSFLSLITNTLEGVVQTTVNAGKAVVGVAVVPLDGGETIEEAIDGALDGLHKVGMVDDDKKETAP